MTASDAKYLKLAEELYLPYTDPVTSEDINSATICNYLDVMKNGLGTPVASPKRVTIIGAGISGMYAAKLLKQAGHNVSIIEANNNRVGGRIKTFRNQDGKTPFKDDLQYGEAGAMRFPTLHPLLNEYISQYFTEEEFQTFYLVDVNIDAANPDEAKVNNRPIRCNSFEIRKKAYQGVAGDSTAEMNQGFDGFESGQTASQLLDEALEPAKSLFANKQGDGTWKNKPYDEWLAGWAQVIELYDHYSMQSYLEEVAGLDKTSLDLIGTIENLTSRMPLAFMHSFLGRSDINPNVTYREFKGGSHALSDKLYTELVAMGVTFHMDHRVTHIDYYDDQFQKKASVEDKYHATAMDPVAIRAVNEAGQVNSTLYSDVAIVTIPFSSFRFVRTTPDLSYKKRRAVIELHYDAATKVLLEFDKRWWEFNEADWETELTQLFVSGQISQAEYVKYMATPSSEERTAGGGSITDNPNRFMYYPSHKVEGSEAGVVLASYTWADDARRWDSMDEEGRYAFALRGLALVHGERIKLFCTWLNENKSTGAATQSWARNPYAFGEAAVFYPKQLTDLHLDTQTVEGPLHFAGEHTSLKHAWVEGALESAIRVAEEIYNLD